MRAPLLSARLCIVVLAIAGSSMGDGGAPAAQGSRGVASTLHNLSVSGPGEVRSQSESEVCKFCHIPHNAVVNEPLWGHALSQVGAYQTPTVRRSGGRVENTPQPDGASRLCLSCHDGTIALGEIGASRSKVAMSGAQRLSRGQRGFLGTDLSGGHPVSISLPATDEADEDADMRVRPASAISGEQSSHLDKNGKVQCTTCHDPHMDSFFEAGRVPHFWVKPTVTEVCLSCHEPR